jgi:hypothetical protein
MKLANIEGSFQLAARLFLWVEEIFFKMAGTRTCWSASVFVCKGLRG